MFHLRRFIKCQIHNEKLWCSAGAARWEERESSIGSTHTSRMCAKLIRNLFVNVANDGINNHRHHYAQAHTHTHSAISTVENADGK